MKYYKKLVFTFAALSIGFIIAISAIFICGSYTSALREKKRLFASDFEQICKYTNDRIQSADNLGQLLICNEFARQYADESDTSPNQYARLMLQNMLKKTVTIAYNGTNNIALSKLDDDYAIMTNSTGSLRFMESNLHITDRQVAQIRAAFSKNANLNYDILIGGTKKKPRYIIARQLMLGAKAPLYLLMSFNEKGFIKTDAIHSADLLIRDNQNQLIYQTSASIDADITAKSKPISSHRLLHQSIYDTSKLQYTMITDKPPLIDRTFILLILTTLLGISVCYLCMRILARRIYSPVSKLLYEAGAGNTVSDEFGYLSGTLKDMSTNMDVLTQTVGEYEIVVENKFFYDLLTGLLEKDEIASHFATHNISDADDPYVAVIVNYVAAVPSTAIPQQIIYDARKAFSVDISGSFQETGLFRIVDISLTVQCCIFKTSDTKGLSDRLKAVLLKTEPEHTLEVSAYVGTIVEHLADIHASYLEAMLLLEDNAYTMLRSKVLTAADADDVIAAAPVYYPLGQEQSLTNAVIQGKPSVYHAILIDIFAKNAFLDNDRIKQLLILLAATIQRLISTTKLDHPAFLPKHTSIYRYLRQCPDMQTLKEKTISVCDTISETLQQQESLSNKGMEHKMIEYIHDNYKKDISLYDLADILNISKNYVSTLFKNYVGQNFKEYLSRYRFDKAVALMNEHPRMKINAVAAQVGLNNVSLGRLFAKYTGQSPSEYQKGTHRISA